MAALPKEAAVVGTDQRGEENPMREPWVRAFPEVLRAAMAMQRT